MRNLKKALSLALALVMLLGMMMVGAGAAEINDIDSVKADNQEAVKVMNAIDIIKGDENGNFNPDGTLKRAEAAVIISKVLLTPAVVEKLSGTQSSFTDVANYEDGWAVPYVEACALPGIIAGNGDGTFDPAGNVTGLQFAKMLLVTLGFDPDSYNGKSNWEMLVQQDAIKAKLDANDVAITGNDLSRADAAQMAFNAVTKYSPSDSNGYKIVGGEPGTDVVFPSVLEAVLYQATQSKAGTLKASVASDTLAVSRFKLASGTKTNELGLTVDIWTVDGEEVYAAAEPSKDYAKTITKAASGNDATAKMKGIGLEDYSVASDAVMIVNGDAENYTFTADGLTGETVTTDNAATRINELLAKTANNGTMYVYATNKVISKIVVVTDYVGQVSNVTAGKDGKPDTVRVPGGSFQSNGYEKGDYVLYNLGKDDDGENAVVNYAKAESFTDTLTRFIGSGSGVATTFKYTFSGKDYTVNSAVASSFSEAVNLRDNVGKEITVWLSANGKIVAAKPVDAAAQGSYVYILGTSTVRTNSDYMNGTSSVIEVTGLNTAGELVTYTVSKIDDNAVTQSAGSSTWEIPTTNNSTKLIQKVWKYEDADDDGLMELTGANVADTSSGLKSGVASVGGNILNSATNFVFIERDQNSTTTPKAFKTVSVKVGNANIGDVTNGKALAMAVKDGVVLAMYVEAAYADESTGSGNVVYLTGTKTSTTTSEGTIYSYTAYDVAGEKMTLTSKNDSLAAGVYSYNTDNTVGTLVTSTKGTVAKVANDTIGVTVSGSTTYYNVAAVVDAPATLCDDVALGATQTVIFTTKVNAATTVEYLWILNNAAGGEVVDEVPATYPVAEGASVVITSDVTDVDVGEDATVYITGNVTGTITTAADSTVTISGNVTTGTINAVADATVTISGDVGSGATITAAKGGKVKIQGNIEKDANITIGSVADITVSSGVKVEEAIILNTATAKGDNLTDLPSGVPVFIDANPAGSNALKIKDEATNDIRDDTIFMTYTGRKVTAGDVGAVEIKIYAVNANGADTGAAVYTESFSPENTNKGNFYISLSDPTDGAGTNLDPNPFTDGSRYHVVISQVQAAGAPAKVLAEAWFTADFE